MSEYFQDFQTSLTNSAPRSQVYRHLVRKRLSPPALISIGMFAFRTSQNVIHIKFMTQIILKLN